MVHSFDLWKTHLILVRVVINLGFKLWKQTLKWTFELHKPSFIKIHEIKLHKLKLKINCLCLNCTVQTWKQSNSSRITQNTGQNGILNSKCWTSCVIWLFLRLFVGLGTLHDTTKFHAHRWSYVQGLLREPALRARCRAIIAGPFQEPLLLPGLTCMLVKFHGFSNMLVP